MTITIFDRLRPYISNILAAIIVPTLAWLASKTGVGLFADPAFAEAVREIVLVWVSVVVTKTMLNKYFNPGNTSSAHLAKAHATEVAVLKGDVPTYVAQPTDDGAVG